jgi:probable HAF family extracellular repeat protein
MSSDLAGFVPVQGIVAINNSGQVVYTFGTDEGFAWASETLVYSNGTYTTLNVLPDHPNQLIPITQTIAINNSGQIAGNYDNGTTPLGGPQGFLYSNGISTTLTDPSAIGPTQSSGGRTHLNGTNVSISDDFSSLKFAGAINDNGQVVGAYVDGTGVHGFLYSNGTYTTLDAPSATNGVDPFGFGIPLGTSAVAINNSGQVVGDYTDATSTLHGFLYSAGTYINLSGPLVSAPGGTLATAINNSGQVVGNYHDSAGSSHGFLYSNGSYITVDDPNDTFGSTSLVGINNIGEVIGNYTNTSFAEQGFVFSGGTYTQISDPLGTEGTFLQSINDLGQIAGYYVDSSRVQHAFEANPPATPPTTIQQEIAGLYAAVYNRTADASGVQYWDNVVAQQPDASGVTVASAANTPISTSDASLLGQLFVATQSAYFSQTYGNLNDSDFVNALYLNMGGQNAETPSAIAYWQNIIQTGEASGLSVQNARAAMVGQFVHDLIDVDLTQWTTLLTPSELETTILRQAVVNNKLAVSLAYVAASANPNGSFLNAHVVGDAAFQAEIRALTGVAVDPSTATVQITGINQAVADHNLADIQPV